MAKPLYVSRDHGTLKRAGPIKMSVTRTPSLLTLVLLFAALLLAMPPAAQAVPSFAKQTGLQCEACHVGAFGPQLTQFGRQFKLNGYTLSDGNDHFPPLAAMALTSFTHTNADQPGGASPGFKGNDNVALD